MKNQASKTKCPKFCSPKLPKYSFPPPPKNHQVSKILLCRLYSGRAEHFWPKGVPILMKIVLVLLLFMVKGVLSQKIIKIDLTVLEI